MDNQHKPLPTDLSDNNSDVPSSNTQPHNVQPSSTRPHRALKLLLILMSLIMVAIIGFVVFLVIVADGGVHSIILNHRPAPDPNSASLINDRNTVTKTIVGKQNSIKQDANLTYFASSTGDICFTGQNNWKIHDNYAHRCIYGITYYYGFNGDFRQTMLNLEQVLKQLGFKQAAFPISYVIKNYYDAYDGKDSSSSTYLVSDLPMMGNLETGQLDWEVNVAEKATSNVGNVMPDSPSLYSSSDTFYTKRNPQNVSVLFKTITTNNRYMLALTIQKDYFNN